MNTNQTIIQTIDELGFLKAQIAELEMQEKTLKARLGDLEAGKYEGDIFRLSISQSVRKTIDADRVRMLFAPEYIEEHLTKTADVRTLRVSARTGKGMVA